MVPFAYNYNRTTKQASFSAGNVLIRHRHFIVDWIISHMGSGPTAVTTNGQYISHVSEGPVISALGVKLVAIHQKVEYLE